MARDFRRNLLEIRCLVVDSLCSGVLCCALECSPVLETFWRRQPAVGIGSSSPEGSPRICSLLAQIDLLKFCAKLIDRYLLNQEPRPLELCLNRGRGVGSLLDRFEFSEAFISN